MAVGDKSSKLVWLWVNRCVQRGGRQIKLDFRRALLHVVAALLHTLKPFKKSCGEDMNLQRNSKHLETSLSAVCSRALRFPKLLYG